MIEVTLDEPTDRIPVALELRTIRKKGIDAPPKLDDRVILGAPAVRLLTPEGVFGDDELRAYLTAERSNARYWLVQFTCTFEHDEKLPFATAWLELALASGAGTAIAYSMEPRKLASDRSVSWNAKLTVPCVLMQMEFGINEDKKIEEVFCEAGKEGTPKPRWKYFRTSSAHIRGLQRMRLVVQAPVATGLSATVRTGATVSHPRFGQKALTYSMTSEKPQDWLRPSAPDS